jgi:hypothetical protein
MRTGGRVRQLRMPRAKRAGTARARIPVRSNLRPREQPALRPLVTAGVVALVRQALRALRRSSRSTRPPSRHRRIRVLRSRANKGRVRHRRLRRSKGRRRQPSHDRNRRLAARPRTPRLRRSLVRHRRRPRLPVRGQPPVQCPFGIRRRLQDLKSLSGRGSALDGRPNGLRAMWWRRRRRSNLGLLLLRSRRRPHLVGQVRHLRRHLRGLRPGHRLVRRCSRGQHRELSPGSRLVRRCSRGQHRELSPGASPAHLVLPAPQRLLVWRPQPPHRSVRRRRPDRPARRRDLAVQARPLAVRPPVRAHQLVPRSPRPHPDRNRVRLPDRRHPPERRVRRCSHLLRRQCRQRARCRNRSSGTH